MTQTPPPKELFTAVARARTAAVYACNAFSAAPTAINQARVIKAMFAIATAQSALDASITV